MRNAINPQVQRSIVHLLNHHKKDLVLSDEELTLNGNDKLRDYFSKQVKNILDDVQTTPAQFSTAGDQCTIKNAYKILAQPQHFIPCSKELAQSLFNAMGTDARIKPASLAVCLYTADNYPATQFVALIKIDPTQVFAERVRTVEDKTVVTFEEIPDVLPTAREKLQKAALISPKSLNETLDLLLLDRQAAGVAEFFALKFLNTKPGLDPQEAAGRFWALGRRTHTLLTSAEAATKRRLTPGQADVLRQHWEVATQKPVIDLDPLVEGLPFSKEKKAAIREEIEREFQNVTQITIDPEYAQAKLTKKTRFRGDYGVLFEVESDHYKDVVLEKTERTEPNGKIITRLVIEVPALQWVK